ncbi:NIPSNAP family protein [Variovorax saccharolyticus]|uniref:NIPSNAP family protein n=1 Tax=Variovorax saccharolyticus TaxID=3053516 RepID=UPI00257832CA|nr:MULTISPECIES: NIPSNAP family protein [unclassified Variovorax]MDM0017491.1 NIPSNAP family protein [Variovorax sp. J22R187]MDM0027009.1 NIPSNAP family protein [Variovorax sp. J31P216]
MIVDLRTYTLGIGAVPAFLQRYAREGLPAQKRHLGPPLGYYTTEVGTLSQVVHLWQYENMADREQRRRALEDDAQWRAYKARSLADGHVIRQENTILNAVNLAALGAEADR